MKASQMVPRNYLAKEDFPAPRLLTIASYQKEKVPRPNETPETRWVLYFAGEDRGLVLNATNVRAVVEALGTDETDQWIGRQIVAFHDPNVEFGGRRVGGVRLRAPKGRAAAAPPPPPPPAPAEEDFDDDVPF
jgi:hypothetical protein